MLPRLLRRIIKYTKGKFVKFNSFISAIVRYRQADYVLNITIFCLAWNHWKNNHCVYLHNMEKRALNMTPADSQRLVIVFLETLRSIWRPYV